jgi:hypothetical protein
MTIFRYNQISLLEKVLYINTKMLYIYSVGFVKIL